MPLPVGLPLQLRGRLAAEARACFSELPESLPREAARGVPADGTVHPLCASTVSLLKRTLGHGAALRVLLGGGDRGAGAGGRGLLAWPAGRRSAGDQPAGLCWRCVDLLVRPRPRAHLARRTLPGAVSCCAAGTAGHAAGASLAAEARLLDEMTAAVGRIFDTLLAGEGEGPGWVGG